MPGARLLSRRGWLAFMALGLILLVGVPALNQLVPPGSRFHLPNYLVPLLGKYVCFALLALSLDLVWGCAGILSLGHGAFFALGGYAMGMHLMREIGPRGVYGHPVLPDFMVFLNWKELPWYWYGFDSFAFAAAMVVLVPGLLAFVFGWLAFRSRVSGVYFSIMTQAMTFALMLAFFRNDMGLARAGLGNVPQGREIFPRLTVEENLRTGFAALPRQERSIPEEVFELFPVLKQMLRRRGGDLSGGQQQQLAIARALVMRPRLLLLDEPTEGIQPSIIKHIGEVIRRLAAGGEMAILLVEQYLDFARAVADRLIIMDRGLAVVSGGKGDINEAEVKRFLTV